MAVTSSVTVTEPPAAIVTEPANTLLDKLKLAVLALALTLLAKPVALNCAGSVSNNEPVSVDGPALLTTSVKLLVLPTASVALPTVLLALRLTTGRTAITALTEAVLVPTDVVKEPAEIVFVRVPLRELVTTTVTVQVEAGGISVPEGSDSEPAPATAVATPELQPVVVTAGVAAFTNPVG